VCEGKLKINMMGIRVKNGHRLSQTPAALHMDIGEKSVVLINTIEEVRRE
jgi:hypothetical protein